MYYNKNDHWQFSYLQKKRDPIYIDNRGYYDPEGTTWFGTMTSQRIGDLLPFEYQPQSKKK